MVNDLPILALRLSKLPVLGSSVCTCVYAILRVKSSKIKFAHKYPRIDAYRLSSYSTAVQ